MANISIIESLDFGSSDDLKNVVRNWTFLQSFYPSDSLERSLEDCFSEMSELLKAKHSLLAVEENQRENAWLCGLLPRTFDSNHFGKKISELYPIISPCFQSLTPDVLERGRHTVIAAVQRAEEQGTELLYATANMSDIYTQQVLQKASFELRDVLVTHRLNAIPLLDCTPDLSIRTVQESDREALRNIARFSFSNRKFNLNRFVCEPDFSEELVGDMYAIWVDKSLSHDFADETLVYCASDTPVGFITIKLPAHPNAVASIPLNAIHPQFHNQGIYSRLVRASLKWLRDRSASPVEIKTQLQNYSVHRTWAQLGAVMTNSVCRFHFRVAK